MLALSYLSKYTSMFNSFTADFSEVVLIGRPTWLFRGLYSHSPSIPSPVLPATLLMELKHFNTWIQKKEKNPSFCPIYSSEAFHQMGHPSWSSQSGVTACPRWQSEILLNTPARYSSPAWQLATANHGGESAFLSGLCRLAYWCGVTSPSQYCLGAVSPGAAGDSPRRAEGPLGKQQDLPLFRRVSLEEGKSLRLGPANTTLVN